MQKSTAKGLRGGRAVREDFAVDMCALARRFVLAVTACASSLLPAVGAANTLWSDDCDVVLNPQSTYQITEKLCVSGDLDYTVPGQFFPSAYVYIVKNRQWQLGDHFVDHFGTPTLIVTTSGGGGFLSVVVQEPPLELGEYDLILDEHGDGVYTADDLVVGVGTDYALVVVSDAFFADGFEYGSAPWTMTRGHSYGVEIDGIPVWFERAMAVINNAVRMAPQDYRDTYMLDHPRNAAGILLPGSYPAVSPLAYTEGLNRAARYHANDLYVNGCGFQHNSCDGTPAGTRVNSFLSTQCYSGEVLHFNDFEARRLVNEWLCPHTGEADCFSDGSGLDNHRALLLSDVHQAFGAGISVDFAVQDYGSCREVFMPPLVDGSHIFFDDDLLFMATYFDSPGYPPQEVVLVLDSVEHTMSLGIGQAEAGTYTVSLSPTGQCRSYFFRATTSPGLVYRYPEAGMLRTSGDGCAETWVP